MRTTASLQLESLYQRLRPPPHDIHGDLKVEQWWAQGSIVPASYAARWCAPRTDDGLLERVGADLTHSAEAIGNYLAETRHGHLQEWLLSCILVTTARLYVARLPLARISLKHGAAEEELPIEPVSHLRFTKGFMSPQIVRAPDDHEPLQDFDELAADNERTLFVVQAQDLLAFLDQWGEAPGIMQPWMGR